MIIHFQPAAGRRYRAVVRRLKRICESVTSLEQIILFWCGKNRRLVATRNEELEFPAVTISFFLRKKLIGFATIAGEDILHLCPTFEPLNETILSFCDKEGYRPDDQWFEERSRRLGIDYRGDYEINFAPARSLAELVMSYVFSTFGYVEVDPIRSDINRRQTIAVKLTLVFLGGEGSTGWCEFIGVARNELVEFINSKMPNTSQQYQ